MKITVEATVRAPIALVWKAYTSPDIGLVPLEPDRERLVAYLERRTPWDS